MVRLHLLAAGWSALVGVRLASAAALTPGDVVIALAPTDQTTGTLAEFTPGGTLVQTFPITGGGDGNSVSGIAVGPNLRPYVFSGHFQPVLWSIDTTTGVTSTTTFAGWSNDGSVANGSLAAFDHYIFASDEFTYQGGEPGGIDRFDLNSGTAQRFLDPNPFTPAGGNVSYDKVAVGYNGKMYALLNNGGFSSPFMVVGDAATMSGFMLVHLPEDANDIAADAAGNLYVLRGYGGRDGGGIDEFDPSYHLLRSFDFGAVPGFVRDLELSPSGNIVVTTSEGTVLLTTTAFTSYTTFDAGQIARPDLLEGIDTAAAAFVQPPVAPVPEPGAIVGLAMAAAILPRRRRVSAID